VLGGIPTRSLKRLLKVPSDEQPTAKHLGDAEVALSPRPQRRDLLTLQKRESLAGLKLCAAEREQIEVALQIIDALDIQLAPFDLELRAYAREQAGCKALAGTIYGRLA
jgi:hypothetical protein